MTELGRQALHQAEAAQQSLEDEILGALNVDERNELAHLLRKAIDGVNAHTAHAKSVHHA